VSVTDLEIRRRRGGITGARFSSAEARFEGRFGRSGMCGVCGIDFKFR
jgi:hypothetical protein